ncbi:MAG: hypothetical protein IT379_22920 [Deltaproteobacteria bacterium]|nr:hypothetical protein [Deltaproteobacteria bacterium]
MLILDRDLMSNRRVRGDAPDIVRIDVDDGMFRVDESLGLRGVVDHGGREGRRVGDRAHDDRTIGVAVVERDEHLRPTWSGWCVP